MKFTTKPKNTYKKIKNSVKEGEVLIVPLDNRLTEDIKPYPAGGKNLPEWFRHSPKDGIRRCAGVEDFLSLGFIIPAWTNFSFYPRPDLGGWEVEIGQLEFAPRQFISDPFPRATTGSCPMTDNRKIQDSPYPKLVNPYSIITAPGWSCIINGIVHEPNPNYDVVTGIVNTDYYHHVNIVLNLTNDDPFTIEYGEPLAHIIPFKRNPGLKDLKFADEEYYKYVNAKGMGAGPKLIKTRPAPLYRKEKKKQDG